MIATRAALAGLAAVLAAGAAAADLVAPLDRPWTGAVRFIAAPELAGRIMNGDGRLRLLDLRPTAAYQGFHIPTAQPVAPGDLAVIPIERGITVVLYGDDRRQLAEAVRVLRSRGYAVLVLREGISEWLGRVHEPRLAVDATPDEQAQFERVVPMSRFFGGVPLSGVPRPEVPTGYWTGAPRTDALLEAAARDTVSAMRRRGC